MATAKAAEKKKEEKSGATTVIRPCTCRNAYQDERYGKGQRLHIVSSKGEYRCTVCRPRRVAVIAPAKK